MKYLQVMFDQCFQFPCREQEFFANTRMKGFNDRGTLVKEFLNQHDARRAKDGGILNISSRKILFFEKLLSLNSKLTSKKTFNCT